MDGNSEDGSHNRVLDEPRPRRAGNDTDNNQQRGGQNNVDRHQPGNRPPSIGIGVLQGCRPIYLAPGCPLLCKAEPSVSGRKEHVGHRQHGNTGDDGCLDVLTGPLKSDNGK